MEITCRVYRPRRARESPLYRLVEQHLEEFLRVYEERFARVHGPLRPVVERVLRAFLECGLVERGFARAWCGTCRLSYLIPYSYRLAADVGFEGHAYYSSSDGKFTGAWFDSLGAVYAIEATETLDALVALWGPAGTPRGRTTYRLLDPDTIEVVDEILAKDGSWSEFARLRYRRQ